MLLVGNYTLYKSMLQLSLMLGRRERITGQSAGIPQQGKGIGFWIPLFCPFLSTVEGWLLAWKRWQPLA